MRSNMPRRFLHTAGLTIFFKHWQLSLTEAFQETHILLSASGKVKRFWLIHFHKSYVQRQLSLRQGACRQCGTCCKMLFTCPLLAQPGLCLSYGTCRPQSCKIFPIDQRDIDEVDLCGGQCGYSFRREDAKPSKKKCHSMRVATNRQKLPIVNDIFLSEEN